MGLSSGKGPRVIISWPLHEFALRKEAKKALKEAPPPWPSPVKSPAKPAISLVQRGQGQYIDHPILGELEAST